MWLIAVSILIVGCFNAYLNYRLKQRMETLHIATHIRISNNMKDVATAVIALQTQINQQIAHQYAETDLKKMN